MEYYYAGLGHNTADSHKSNCCYCGCCAAAAVVTILRSGTATRTTIVLPVVPRCGDSLCVAPLIITHAIVPNPRNANHTKCREIRLL